MSRALTSRMPIIRVKILIGPVTLRHREASYDKHFEPWPKSMPKELEVSALIDTGASVTIIDASIVEALQLRNYGYCPISGFDSQGSAGEKPREYPNYEAGIVLLESTGDTPLLTVKTGQVVGHTIKNSRFEVLIGMDVLKHCQFFLDGPNDSFEISAHHPVVEEMSSVSVNGS